jgi:HEAT repeat protein
MESAMPTTIDKRTRGRISRHIENLNSDDEQVSSRAGRYLIRYYGVRALDYLLEVCNHRNPVVRFRAAWALGHTGAPEAFEALLRLTDDPDERVRYDATMALGVLGDMRAAKPLFDMWLLADVSRPAPVAIMTLGVKALPFVEKALQEGSAGMRHTAVLVLWTYVTDDGSTRAIELLKGSLDDPDSDVRETAKLLLEEIDSYDDDIQ